MTHTPNKGTLNLGNSLQRDGEGPAPNNNQCEEEKRAKQDDHDFVKEQKPRRRKPVERDECALRDKKRVRAHDHQSLYMPRIQASKQDAQVSRIKLCDIVNADDVESTSDIKVAYA